MDPVSGAPGAGPRTTRISVVAAGALAVVVGALVLAGLALLASAGDVMKRPSMAINGHESTW